MSFTHEELKDVRKDEGPRKWRSMTPEQLDDLSIRTALAAGAKRTPFIGFNLLLLNGNVVARECGNGLEVEPQHTNYATSMDAFREDIVPVLLERGKWGAFVDEIFDSLAGEWEGFDKSLAVALLNISLDLEPHELCKAAIKVLEEKR